MFEVAKIIGKQNVDEFLIPLMLEILDSSNFDIWDGALSNLGIFLEQVSEENRAHFLIRIENASNDNNLKTWWLNLNIAKNIG